jgi:hypothetical protein
MREISKDWLQNDRFTKDSFVKAILCYLEKWIKVPVVNRIKHKTLGGNHLLTIQKVA